MQPPTRREPPEELPDLPPPPAPTSRDANPWAVASPEPRPGPARPRRRTRLTPGPNPHPVPRTAERTARESRRKRWIPLAAFVTFVGIGLYAGFRALATGDAAGAIGPFLIAAFAFVVLGRWLRRRR